MKLPVYNCIIDENLDDETGIYAMSFVDSPANEADFVTLTRQKDEYLSCDTQKQILTGVVLKPEQLIYRNSPSMGEYYIRFSAQQIEKIAQKMMRNGIALCNTTHQHQTPLSGNYLTELWIVENPEKDKSRALGFGNLPRGTLMCSYKIEDRNYWEQEIMTGHVKGFSIEGLFNQEISMSRLNKKVKMNKSKKRQSLFSRMARHLLDSGSMEGRDSTGSGSIYLLFTLSDGKEVYVDWEGFATLDEEQMPAGEHKLADGNLLVIDEEGSFIETKESTGKQADTADAKAPEALRRYRQRMAKAETEESQPQDQQPTDAKGNNEVLKQKIAEMQKAIDELSAALDEAGKQVEALRKKTPSARPATARSAQQDLASMSTAERMAVALNETLHRRK